MFTVYQKIKTPDSSPVLGPIPAPNNNNATTESFLLCNYCCSHRNNMNDNSKKETIIKNDTNDKNETNDNTGDINKNDKHPDACNLCIPESKYPFGHATHYTYRVTTPRILCAFETGTPPSP